jgi:hypothetical protein
MKDYLKQSKPVRKLIERWKTILANKFTGSEIKSLNIRKPITKPLTAILRIYTFLTSRSPSGPVSTNQQNGSKGLT